MTQTRWVIASNKRAGDWNELSRMLREDAVENQLVLQGACIVEGPGCYNWGLLIKGDAQKAEAWVKTFATVMMPAKFAIVLDDCELEVGVFRNGLVETT